jgi:hypothetical protein
VNRWLIVLSVVAVGCVASLPADDSLTADLACEVAREAVRMRQLPPAPEPSPKPGECCKQCKGTGFITHGDGHRTPCPCPPNCVCKKPKTAQPCPDGKCPK